MILLHTRLLLSYYQTRPDHSYLFILGARYLLCLALVQRQSYKIVQAFCKNRNLTHYLNFWNAIRFLFYFFFFSNKKKWSCGTRFFVPSMKEVISSISNNFHYNYLPAQDVTPSCYPKLETKQTFLTFWHWNKQCSAALPASLSCLPAYLLFREEFQNGTVNGNAYTSASGK